MAEIKGEKFRGSKIKYPDGIGCCIWIPFEKKINESENDEDESSGLCFDFSYEDINDLLNVINKLKTIEPENYIADLKYEEFIKKREQREKKWWYKLYDFLNDISFQFTPFDWKFRKMLLSKKVPGNKNNSEYCYQHVWHGFFFGPFCITW